MSALLPVALLTASQLVMVSDVPTLNFEPSCRAVAAAPEGQVRNPDACFGQERRARAELEQQWDQFSSRDRARCLQLSRLGGFPSYVELLTCLQIAKEAEKVPDDGLDGRAVR